MSNFQDTFTNLPPSSYQNPLSPAQQARLTNNPSLTDLASLQQPGSPRHSDYASRPGTSEPKDKDRDFERPHRSASMLLTATSPAAPAPPQPLPTPGASSTSAGVVRSPTEYGGLGRSGSSGALTIDGSEPRIFPRVVGGGGGGGVV